jgi:hypothetical protein
MIAKSGCRFSEKIMFEPQMDPDALPLNWHRHPGGGAATIPLTMFPDSGGRGERPLNKP